MKITIDTAKLTELTDIATRFIAKNATLPILQNIYIKASIDSLIIRATDMEKYIEAEDMLLKSIAQLKLSDTLK